MTEGHENLGCALFDMTVRSASGTRGMAQLGCALGEETRYSTARSLEAEAEACAWQISSRVYML